ncbi:MAG TPA: hypothetical protein VM103_00570 [Candidatus Paceibacterota bacterium]|nr:hypothetical protein [Candidatus Paceibacterota bacterium]
MTKLLFCFAAVLFSGAAHALTLQELIVQEVTRVVQHVGAKAQPKNILSIQVAADRSAITVVFDRSDNRYTVSFIGVTAKTREAQSLAILVRPLSFRGGHNCYRFEDQGLNGLDKESAVELTREEIADQRIPCFDAKFRPVVFDSQKPGEAIGMQYANHRQEQYEIVVRSILQFYEGK